MAGIAFEEVTKRFGETVAVDRLSLRVADGEFLVLVGPSGCGKSTALRMLAGLEEITEGRILIGDRVVNNVAPAARNVAMVFQSYALYPHMTVFDNMAFALRNQGTRRADVDRRVREAARILDLDPLLERKPKQLSGGQRQRVALGRAIVREPEAFLMDEPLSNLDAALRVATRAEILKLQRRLGTTTIYVTHDQVEAMTMGDRIAVLRSGVLQQVGSPEELYERPANVFVAGFIGSPAMNLVPAALVDGPGGSGRIVGFRPEHVTLGNGGGLSFPARVEVVEYLGDERLVHLVRKDTPLLAKVPAAEHLEPGQELEVAVAAEKLHVFDATSERRLDAVSARLGASLPVAARDGVERVVVPVASGGGHEGVHDALEREAELLEDAPHPVVLDPRRGLHAMRSRVGEEVVGEELDCDRPETRAPGPRRRTGRLRSRRRRVAARPTGWRASTVPANRPSTSIARSSRPSANRPPRSIFRCWTRRAACSSPRKRGPTPASRPATSSSRSRCSSGRRRTGPERSSMAGIAARLPRQPSKSSLAPTTSATAPTTADSSSSRRRPSRAAGSRASSSSRYRARISALTFTLQMPSETARRTSASGRPDAPCSESGTSTAARDPLESLPVQPGRLGVGAVHVADRDGETVGARLGDEDGRLVGIRQRPRRRRDCHVLAALDMSQLRLDAQLGRRSSPSIPCQRRVLAQRQPRAVRHHRSDPGLDRRRDHRAVLDVVELDAAGHARLAAATAPSAATSRGPSGRRNDDSATRRIAGTPRSSAARTTPSAVVTS